MPKKAASIDVTDPKHLSQKQRTKLKNKLQQLQHQKEVEDMHWQETDKNVIKKQMRKEEKELKKYENSERKKLLKNKAELELEEMEKSSHKNKRPQHFVQRVTQAQISESQRVTGSIGRTNTLTLSNNDDINTANSSIDSINRNDSSKSSRNVVKQNFSSHENINRLNSDTACATNVDDAINILSTIVGGTTIDSGVSPSSFDASGGGNKTRSSVIFNSFKQRELARLKAAHPSLKYSQLNQMVVKLWSKSAENPANIPN